MPVLYYPQHELHRTTHPLLPLCTAAPVCRARAARADTYERARSIRAANLEPGEYPGYG